MALYNLITEDIYLKSIYIEAITCEKNVGRTDKSRPRNIFDVGPTRTVLSGMTPAKKKILYSLNNTFSLIFYNC